MRVSLGAGKGRLAVQLLVEGVLLAVLGGAAGLALAVGATRGLVAMGAPGVPRLAELDVDATVLVFTMLISGLTSIVLGMVPLLQLTGGVLTFRVSPPQNAFSAPADLRLFYEQLRTSLSHLAGVDAVGGVSIPPLTYGTWYTFVREDAPPPSDEPQAELRAVEPGYFQSVGIPLVSGRLLEERDGANAPPVLLVDQAMAREHFPGENPVGKRITVPWGAGVDPVSYEIVGVVGEVRHEGPTSPPGPTLYVPRGQDTTPYWVNRSMSITVRTSGDPLALAESARGAVWEIDPTVPVTDVDALDRNLRAHFTGPRNEALLIGFFAVLATVLASVGVGGVVAYAVIRRGHEIGVRQALGADGGDVVRLILVEGLKLMALGLPVGLLLAAVGSRLLRTLLFGVAPGDPLTYASVALALAGVTLVAAWIPARRALTVHPATAFRADR